jgi:hypothetical protein
MQTGGKDNLFRTKWFELAEHEAYFTQSSCVEELGVPPKSMKNENVFSKFL